MLEDGPMCLARRSGCPRSGQDREEDELPLDSDFAEILLTWKLRLEAEREAQKGISTPLGGPHLPQHGTSTPALRSKLYSSG